MADSLGQLWDAAMRAGDFERAWQISDCVMAARAGKRFDRELPRHEQPIWSGEPLAGRRVLVRCYHGLGDTIQFARFLPKLRDVARQVIVWAQPALLDLLRSVGGIDTLMPLHDGAPDVAYDADIEIMELQHFFRTTIDTIPREVPYLHASRAELPESSQRKVGLAWRAGDWNAERNIDLRLFEPLLARDDVSIYALQLDVRPDERDPRIIFDDRRLTVTGTAELMRALDLVITTDSMPAHLSGALGIPTWTLIPHHCDWRWMNDRTDSPWYPTMRLFRQRVPGDWRNVIENLAHSAIDDAHG